MRTIRRRTQIDIETHEVVVIRNTGERPMPVCGHCGRGGDNDARDGMASKNDANYCESSDIKLVTIKP